MNKQDKNGVGWCDTTWNPITGCKNTCFFCYARKIATRFKGSKAFPNGFEPTFHWNRLSQPMKLKRPSKIFVCSMGELFGNWVRKDWVEEVFNSIQQSPQHIFQILTKYPQNIKKFILGIPDNVWLGITITGKESEKEQISMSYSLKKIDAKVRFVSFEPLLDMPFGREYLNVMNWVIIGGLTPINVHRKEWIDKILEDAKGIPVFIKRNAHYPIIRKEFPFGSIPLGNH